MSAHVVESHSQWADLYNEFLFYGILIASLIN